MCMRLPSIVILRQYGDVRHPGKHVQRRKCESKKNGEKIEWRRNWRKWMDVIWNCTRVFDI